MTAEIDGCDDGHNGGKRAGQAIGTGESHWNPKELDGRVNGTGPDGALPISYGGTNSALEASLDTASCVTRVTSDTSGVPLPAPLSSPLPPPLPPGGACGTHCCW